MGPGFVRRDVLPTGLEYGERWALQWGPASFAGMCPHSAVVTAQGYQLQWGPASFAGMCSVAGAFIRLVSMLQWGPASFAGMCGRPRDHHPV